MEFCERVAWVAREGDGSGCCQYPYDSNLLILLSRPTEASRRNRSVLVLPPARFRTTKTHSGLPNEAQCAGHNRGWQHYLGRLTIAAGGGNPGIDHGPAHR